MSDLSLVLCGEAGQGIQTVEKVLTAILKEAGYHVFATKEYMSRVRGGVNSTSIRISSLPVRSYVERIDLLIPLSPGRTKHLEKRITTKTKVLDTVSSNLAAIGIVCGLLKIDIGRMNEKLQKYTGLEDATKGYEQGRKLERTIVPDPAVQEEILVNGAEAVSLGAIAGGCNFLAAYPMTPSTGVLTFFAAQAEKFGLVVEQVEDEIAGINMALGAWYAGGRAMASTSGGGFALMIEGLSLAGMIESPLVVHLAQRPGPATGLPTRTEQGDLNLALYAGHGEFPRIILAPGNLEQAFELSARAFDLADKFQVPVFLLTDQYLNDSYYDLPAFDLDAIKVNKQFVSTTADYKRYVLTPNGISPRGIPGFGDGLVCVDSDEHDEHGYITEDLTDVRPRMVEKRLAKMKLIREAAILIPPQLIGPKKYQTLVVCWGSTLEIVKEALVDRKETAILHFSQVFPVHQEAGKFLQQAKEIVVVENNAAGQFADLFEKETGCKINRRILKYDGLPFSVEEIEERVNG